MEETITTYHDQNLKPFIIKTNFHLFITIILLIIIIIITIMKHLKKKLIRHFFLLL
jgi:hypothetical protein